MRGKRLVLTAFILGPLVVLVVLCWMIKFEIDRQNREGPRAPNLPAPQKDGPHG